MEQDEEDGRDLDGYLHCERSLLVAVACLIDFGEGALYKWTRNR